MTIRFGRSVGEEVGDDLGHFTCPGEQEAVASAFNNVLAGAATGAFPNHFPAVADFFAALAQDVGRGIEIGQAILIDIENDPAARVAIGTLQLLQMPDPDPAAASAFVMLVAMLADFGPACAR